MQNYNIILESSLLPWNWEVCSKPCLGMCSDTLLSEPDAWVSIIQAVLRHAYLRKFITRRNLVFMWYQGFSSIILLTRAWFSRGPGSHEGLVMCCLNETFLTSSLFHFKMTFKLRRFFFQTSFLALLSTFFRANCWNIWLIKRQLHLFRFYVFFFQDWAKDLKPAGSLDEQLNGLVEMSSWRPARPSKEQPERLQLLNERHKWTRTAKESWFVKYENVLLFIGEHHLQQWISGGCRLPEQHAQWIRNHIPRGDLDPGRHPEDSDSGGDHDVDARRKYHHHHRPVVQQVQEAQQQGQHLHRKSGHRRFNCVLLHNDHGSVFLRVWRCLDTRCSCL